MNFNKYLPTLNGESRIGTIIFLGVIILFHLKKYGAFQKPALTFLNITMKKINTRLYKLLVNITLEILKTRLGIVISACQSSLRKNTCQGLRPNEQ